MPRYIDADELYKATQKRIAEANEARMAVVDDEFLDLIDDAFTEDVAPRAEWISVEERLPEESGDYITYHDHGHCGVIYYNASIHLWNVYYFKDTQNAIRSVTHWMPLPVPPKGAVS